MCLEESLARELAKIEEREVFRYHRVSSVERERIIRELREIFSNNNDVLLVVLFGSILRHEYVRDIDVAIYVREPCDPLEYKIRMDMELSNRLGYRVDVTILNNAPPYIVKHVLEKGIIVLEKDPIQTAILYKKAVEQEQAIQYLETITSRQ